MRYELCVMDCRLWAVGLFQSESFPKTLNSQPITFNFQKGQK